MKSYFSESAIDIQRTFDKAGLSRIIEKDLKSGLLGKLTEGTSENSQGSATRRTLEPQDMKKDLIIYEVFLKTYANILIDRVRNPYACNSVVEFIFDKGLLTWIKESSEFFDNFIYNGVTDRTKPMLCSLLELILSTEYSDYMSIQVASEIFRFGKRFAPFGTYDLEAKCYADFLESERLNRQKDRAGDSEFVLQQIRPLAQYFFSSWEHVDLELCSDPMYISPNAISQLCTCKFCKQIALESYYKVYNPYMSDAMQGELAELVTLRPLQQFKDLWVAETRNPLKTPLSGDEIVVMQSVPKNWKSYRLIAPDSVFNYHKACVVERQMRDLIENVRMPFIGTPLINHVPLFDQSGQRDRAQQGSIDGSVATADLSAASDFHRKVLVKEIYPSQVSSDILSSVPKGAIVNDKARLLSSLAPMGSPLTFRTMQFTLFLICFAVTLFVARMSEWDQERLNQALKRIGVFGDDITIDSMVYETLVEWLTALGFVVNVNKSCNNQVIGQRFREACGGDYYEGIDISVSYWPRHQFDLTESRSPKWHEDGFTFELRDNVNLLIALSKNIRKFSSGAADYLTNVCRSLESKLTVSTVGSTSPDLWSEFPQSKQFGKSPYGLFTWTLKPGTLTNSLIQLYGERYGLRKGSKTITDDQFNGLPPFMQKAFYRRLEKKIEERDVGMELTSVPSRSNDLKVATSKGCVVEEYLLKHRMPIYAMVEYQTYLDYLTVGPDYGSELDRLLGVTCKRRPSARFGTGELTWKLSK